MKKSRSYVPGVRAQWHPELNELALNEAPLTGFRFQFQAHVLGGNKRLRPDQTYPLLKKSLFLRTAIKALAREEVAPRFSYVFLIVYFTIKSLEKTWWT